MSRTGVLTAHEHEEDASVARSLAPQPIANGDGRSTAVFSVDQIANVLTDGYWSRAGASRRAFDVENDTVTVDLSGLTSEGWSLARTALNAWTVVTGINFVQVARPATSPGYETGDAGQDPSSTIPFGMNQHILGNLTSASDQDWYETTLVAGKTYLAKLTGTGEWNDLADPVLRLRDATGQLLAENDQADGFDSLIEFTPTVTGRYIYEADGYAFNSGAYYLTVTEAKAAQIGFGDSDRGAYSTSDVTGGTINRSFVNVATDWLATSGTSLDSYSFQTYIHEIGHALGLGHAGFYNGWATYERNSHYENDSWQASVMSYFSQIDNTAIDADYAYVLTPMAADIVAIQTLYGAPASVNAGDTVYGANSNLGGYLGQVSAAIFNGVDVGSAYSGHATTMTIVDSHGHDTFDTSTSTVDQTIDLRAEAVSSVMGVRGNVVIARGTVIENATGGSANDTLHGNAASNVLTGGRGNDRLLGENGRDTLKGGDGDDVLMGGAGRDTLDGGGGHDRLLGDEKHDLLYGGAGDDTLTGGLGDDTLFGGDGNDHAFGGAGYEHIHGGAGSDYLVGDGRRDFLFGDTGNDTILGGNGYDRLFGGIGDDRLDGGIRNDRLTGGGGSDTFVFARGRQTDRVRDFQDDLDRIELNSDLWTGTLDVAEVLSRWGSVTSRGVVLEFETGDILMLDRVRSTDVLLDDVIIV